MPFVNRDEAGKVTGVYVPQQYKDQEFVQNDNPALVEFYKSQRTLLRQNARTALLAEVDNATSVDQLKTILKKLIG
jgi:hypothetical protein